MADRTPRGAETREETARTQTWKPPELLPMAPENPDWKYRWIRTAILGEQDTLNVGMKRREGWEFIKACDMPDIAMQAGLDPGSEDRIEIGGLAYAKIPAELLKQREDYYTGLANAQVTGVREQLLREQDPRMPMKVEFSSKTTGGRF